MNTNLLVLQRRYNNVTRALQEAGSKEHSDVTVYCLPAGHSVANLAFYHTSTLRPNIYILHSTQHKWKVFAPSLMKLNIHEQQKKVHMKQILKESNNFRPSLF
jgi:hypothetical protein